MLSSAAEQGVQVQILTPHFYRWREDIPDFLSRRDAGEQKLRLSLTPNLPQIFVGAEVAFFHRMSESDLRPLCIGDSRLLLVEMPFESWNRETEDEIAHLSLDKGYQVILAHIERFLGYKGNAEIIESLARLPIVFQINAEALLSWSSRRRMISFIRSGKPVILATDAHNLTNRRPNLLAGRSAVEKKLGSAALRDMDDLGEELLKRNLALL